MTTRILRSNADNTFEECGVNVTLESLQGIVGGDIEAVRITDGAVLIVNETGTGLPVNAAATELAQVAGQLVPGAVVRGDVVLAGITPGGDFVDAPADIIMALMALTPNPTLRLVAPLA